MVCEANESVQRLHWWRKRQRPRYELNGNDSMQLYQHFAHRILCASISWIVCFKLSPPPPLALFLSVCSIHSLCCVSAGCVSLYIRVCCWCIRCTIAPARITIQTGDQTSQRHKAKQHTNITRTNVERYGKNRNGHQLKFILYVTHSVWTAFPSNSCLQSFGKYVQCYATGVTKYIDDCIWLFF